MDKKFSDKVKPILIITLLILFNFSVFGQDYDPYDYLFIIPEDTSEWSAFRQELIDWRSQMLSGYNDSYYSDTALKWTQGLFLITFCTPWTSTLVDEKGNVNVADFLEYHNDRYGGCDFYLMFNGFPDLGLDMRNQWDYYRSFSPYDGVNFTGLADLVQQLKDQSGVKFGFAYFPWDVDTKREPVSDMQMFHNIFTQTGSDAIFWDTMDGDYSGLLDSLHNIKPDIALMSEHSPNPDDPDFKENMNNILNASLVIWEDVHWGIIKPKWFERRHGINVLDDLMEDDNTEISRAIQLAFFNGCGIWLEEDHFGNVQFISPADISWIKLIMPILHRYQGHFTNQAADGWLPCVDTKQHGIYASEWKKDSIRIWTVVNRNQYEQTGDILEFDHNDGDIYYDIIKGKMIEPVIEYGNATISDTIRPKGQACYISGTDFDVDFLQFLQNQKTNYENADWNTKPPETELLYEPAPFKSYNYIPKGMIGFPEESEVDIEILSYHWEEIYEETLPPFAIDKYSVTNSEWKQFIDESGYIPENTDNYLTHWDGGYLGKPEPGRENFPVVHISPSDAKEYADYYGKRLPTINEFQFANDEGIIQNGEYQVWNFMGEVFYNTFVKWVFIRGGTEFAKPVNNNFPNALRDFYAPDAGNLGMLTWEEIDNINNSTIAWEVFLGPPALQRFENVGFRCAVDLENDIEEDNFIILFPNPAKDYIFIDSRINIQNFVEEIFDMQGRLIKTAQITNQYKIDISSLSPAVYQLKISEEDTYYLKRFVKM